MSPVLFDLETGDTLKIQSSFDSGLFTNCGVFSEGVMLFCVGISRCHPFWEMQKIWEGVTHCNFSLLTRGELNGIGPFS